MTNDFVYDMSQINEEEIMKGWEEIAGDDDGEGYDPIMGDSEGFDDTDDQWLDDFQGEEDFA